MSKKVIIGMAALFLLVLSLIFFTTKDSSPKITRYGGQGSSPSGKNILKESPILAARVAEGTLSPFEERMPKVPVIVQPVERVGTHGGTWRMAMKSKRDHGSFVRTIGYDNLLRWNTAWTGIIPNIAASYEVNDAVTEYTIHLREGMKWSDGALFTADDIMFWYDDIFSREEFKNVRPAWLMVNGMPARVVKIDIYTVKFIFAGAYGLFPSALANPQGAEPTSYPKHYLSQFHPKYNADIEALAKKEKVKDWKELFEKKFGLVGTIDEQSRWQHPEVPTLHAWVLKTVYDDTAKAVVAERNPFYWKMDTAGAQLPYIDTVVFQVIDDNDARLAAAYRGDIDMQDRHIGNSFLTNTATRSLLESHAAEGNYAFFETVFASMNTMAISFNLTHNDPTMRNIFQDKNFRIGMSHAINRKEIIDTIMGGQGIPYQLAPRPESPFYNERLAKQYTEYDTTKANEYLDKAGLASRDAKGYRLRPDGKRFSFTLEWGDPKFLELLRKHWDAVGIEMKIGNTTDRTNYYDQKAANLHDAGTWAGDGGLDVIEDPRYYFPYSHESNYAERWALWFVDPKHPLAEEPPEKVKEQQELFRSVRAVSDPSAQKALMRKILDIAVDQFYAIGISLPDKGYGIVKKNFHNVPAIMPSAWTYPNPSPTNPAQYFLD